MAPEVEEAVLAFAEEFLADGQVRASNELRKRRGIDVSPTGIRGVWIRHDLRTMKQRLRRLEAKAAAEGLILTEAQVVALEKLRADQEATGEEIGDCQFFCATKPLTAASAQASKRLPPQQQPGPIRTRAASSALEAFWIARYSTLRTDSGVGNAPRFFVTLRMLELIDSIALVV